MDKNCIHQQFLGKGQGFLTSGNQLFQIRLYADTFPSDPISSKLGNPIPPKPSWFVLP
jgi:hypothetical protein